ncbi:hypothetical protein ACJXBB_001693 [Vibrio cholerae]|uniref:hypothetical protein n=1 Tax=Vibrio cholerae TaxID=666 RepID=UPI0038789CB4
MSVIYNEKIIALFIFSFFLSSAYAGNQAGKVSWIVVHASYGLIYFGIDGSLASGKPHCASSSYWMIRDENSNVGKQQYSMLLSAHASGKTIEAIGMNTCIPWANGEDVNSITIK